jgi:hypothetical protein
VADKYPDIAQQISAKMKEYITSGEGLTLSLSERRRAANSTGASDRIP